MSDIMYKGTSMKNVEAVRHVESELDTKYPVRDKLYEEMANADDLLNIFDTRKKTAPVFNWGITEPYDPKKPKPLDDLFIKYSSIKNKTDKHLG